MKTKKIWANGENLSFLDSGYGEITLLFIHGACINKEYWENQLLYFKKQYRVIALDLAGHRESTHHRNDWAYGTFGRDLNEFMEHLSLDNIILIGHSFGSDIMLETFAITSSKIIGLIEVDHMKNVGEELPTPIVEHLTTNLRTDFKTTCEQYARQALMTKETNPQLVNRFLKDYDGMKPDIGIPLLQNGFGYPQREVKLLQDLHQKLYLIHVSYTPTDKEKLSRYLNDNYELRILDGTCHYPMLEIPEIFNSTLGHIIDKILQDGGTNKITNS